MGTLVALMEHYHEEEKNIKRRVYDALNVLIASRVLTKQGKKVRGSASEKTIATMHFSQKIVKDET
jgi:transcription factor Dp-1